MQSWPMVRPVYADIRDFLTNYIGKKFNNKARTGPRSAARFEPEVYHRGAPQDQQLEKVLGRPPVGHRQNISFM